MANTVYESKEYERLVRRKFKPYSEGHQRMYTTAIEKIKRERPDGVHVFEAGFGIGFGLTKMVEAGIINDYTGCEPNAESYQYTLGMVLGVNPFEYIDLLHAEFNQTLANEIIAARAGRGMYDEAFCIEVIEHVPLHLHLQFLIALRQMAPRLWFSSPDKTKSKEGVRTTKEWGVLLKQAQFTSIEVDQTNWTYLYECR